MNRSIPRLPISLQYNLSHLKLLNFERYRGNSPRLAHFSSAFSNPIFITTNKIVPVRVQNVSLQYVGTLREGKRIF